MLFVFVDIITSKSFRGKISKIYILWEWEYRLEDNLNNQK